MSVNDNIAAQIHNELNPRQDEAVGGLLYEVREAYTEKYASRLRGEFATNPQKRAEKLQEFRNEFDDKIGKQITAGSEDKNADPSLFHSEEEKKTAETTKGFFGMAMDMILGGLGWLGNILGMILKAVGFDSLAAKFITDKTSDKKPGEKTREQRAAGMATSLGKIVDVNGMEVQFSAEEQAQLYRQWSKQDFEQVIERNSTPERAKAQAGQAGIVVEPGTRVEEAKIEEDKKPDVPTTETTDRQKSAENQETSKTAAR